MGKQQLIKLSCVPARAQLEIFSFPLWRGSVGTAGGHRPTVTHEAPTCSLTTKSRSPSRGRSLGRRMIHCRIPARCHLVCPSAPRKTRARAPCPSQHPWDPPAPAASCSRSAGCMLPHFLRHLSPVLLQTCAAFPLLSPLQKQGQSAGPARACELFVLRGAAAHSGDLYLISPVCCLPAWGCEGLV